MDDDHYGLEKVKERIVEYLAVQQRSKQNEGPNHVLGRPTRGGQNLAGQIRARRRRGESLFVLVLEVCATNPRFVVIGGRTLARCPARSFSHEESKTTNPLILFDEIDKMGQDFRGDPASAMLEVLDPEQNATFVDHYLEVEYDLSNVMFLTTANSYNMPRPFWTEWR